MRVAREGTETMTRLEAINQTLEGRWHRILEAKDLRQIRFCIGDSHCYLCIYHNCGSERCDYKCLNVNGRDSAVDTSCCYEYSRFRHHTVTDPDYTKAIYWAKKVVGKIEALRKREE